MGRHFKPPGYRAAIGALPVGEWVEIAIRRERGWVAHEGAPVDPAVARDAVQGGDLVMATRRHADGTLRLLVKRTKH